MTEFSLSLSVSWALERQPQSDYIFFWDYLIKAVCHKCGKKKTTHQHLHADIHFIIRSQMSSSLLTNHYAKWETLKVCWASVSPIGQHFDWTLFKVERSSREWSMHTNKERKGWFICLIDVSSLPKHKRESFASMLWICWDLFIWFEPVSHFFNC